MNLDNIAIIALTAQDDEDIKTRAANVGMEDYSTIITSYQATQITGFKQTAKKIPDIKIVLL
jgi:hypothetical protein